MTMEIPARRQRAAGPIAQPKHKYDVHLLCTDSICFVWSSWMSPGCRHPSEHSIPQLGIPTGYIVLPVHNFCICSETSGTCHHIHFQWHHPTRPVVTENKQGTASQFGFCQEQKKKKKRGRTGSPVCGYAKLVKVD
jgi:hypothetical protein